eukprot:5451227-Pyramimonas_sp.AAC.1
MSKVRADFLDRRWTPWWRQWRSHWRAPCARGILRRSKKSARTSESVRVCAFKEPNSILRRLCLASH